MTQVKMLAALLVARDRLTDNQIAQKCGIGKRTLETWKGQPEFRAKVEEHLQAWWKKVHGAGIADKRQRVFRLHMDRHRLDTIRLKRAEYFKNLKDREGNPVYVAGSETGLVMEKLTAQGVEYRVDYGYLRAMNHLEEQAARELGQWKEISERRVRRMSDLSAEDLDEMVKAAEEEYGYDLVHGPLSPDSKGPVQ